MAAVISRRAALAGSLAVLAAPAAKAAGTLRVGKAVSENIGYIPLDVGMKYGLFQKEGLEIEKIDFTGGAKLAQAVAAGALDIALGSGPDMAFTAKGAPQIAVATIAASPAFMGISVGNQFAGNGVGALEGKKIGVTTVGSVTYWLVDELNRTQGWSGGNAAVQVAIGGAPTAGFAGLKTGQIDASIGSVQAAFQLEEQHAGRLLLNISAFVKTLELFVTFASTAIIQKDPDGVRRFLKGWYETIAFMKSHKAETVQLSAEVIGFSPAISERAYDDLMPQFSSDGKFEPEAMKALFSSFVEMKSVDPSVDMTKLYTEEFLPKA